MTTVAPCAVTPGARRLVSRACELADANGARRCGLNHYLEALAWADAGLLSSVTGGEVDRLPEMLLYAIAAGEPGGHWAVESLLVAALEAAAARGADAAWDIDVAVVLLERAGIWGADAGQHATGSKAERERLLRSLRDVLSRELARRRAVQQVCLKDSAGADNESPSVTYVTPALDEHGRDVTADAAAGKLAPMVGRDDEVQACIEILCRVTKRNPVLIGPAGVGKTAIVEGLAQRMASGDVPAPLEGMRIVELLLSSLMSRPAHEPLEGRLTAVLEEAAFSHTILFIDELHMVLGGGVSYRDISQLLKPALARGEVAVIGATTDDEYQRIVAQDAALERRFSPIRVPEMDRLAAFRVLQAHRDSLQHVRGVELGDETLSWLVGFADDYMRNRRFPDKALDLLEQCIAHAVVTGKPMLDIGTAETVAQRIVGMPLDVSARLGRFADSLAATAILEDADAQRLLDQLSVSMSGHDFEPERPNAAVLLAGAAADRADLLAALCADALYGSARRVVTIDVAGLRAGDNASLARLFGMPYGFTGADLNKGAVQVLNSQPWTSVIVRNVDLCDDLYRGFVTDALTCGHFVDAHRVKQYLSDSVVFLTVSEIDLRTARLGFGPADAAAMRADSHSRLEQCLGKTLVGLCQVVTETGPPEAAAHGWLTEIAVPALGERYARTGVLIAWEEAALDLLAAMLAESGPETWRSRLESRMAPRISALLRDVPQRPLLLRVGCDGAQITVLAAAVEAPLDPPSS